MKLVRSIARRRNSAGPQMVEALEGRRMLSGVKVASVLADNRGEVTLGLGAAVNAATVNKNSVQMYTAGRDNILGNADDTRVVASVKYSPSLHRITIEGNTAANIGYRVKLVATRLRDSTGTALDGEFNGTRASGNGVAGGNYEFQSKNDKSATPTARLSTSAGVITLKLFRSLKPVSVANFLSYANDGSYDGIFISRSISGFIEQTGSVKVTSANRVAEIRVGSPITNEFTTNGVIHNTAYTVAFAKVGGDANSATNQFFFNTADNSSNLDAQNGGFTVFATAANASSEAVLTAIEGKTTTDFSTRSPFSTFSSTDTTTVPVNSSYSSSAGLNPGADLVVFRRVSLVMKVGAVA